MITEENQIDDKQSDKVCDQLVHNAVVENAYQKGEYTEKENNKRSGLLQQCILTAVIAIAAVGGGMPIGYSATLLPQLKSPNGSIQIDDDMGSWIASIHSIATPTGAFFSGTLMNRFGRKMTIQISTIPFVLGWTCIGLAPCPALILIGRVLTGAAVALTLAPCHVYIAEIANPNVRGVLCSVPHASFIFGIFLIYLLGSIANWRLVAAICTIFPTTAAFLFFFLHESPLWLIRKSKTRKAHNAFLWFQGGDVVQVEKEMEALNRRIQNEKLQQKQHSESIWTSVSSPQFLKPFIIINTFHLLQILTGPYAIVFYAVEIISYMGIKGVNYFFTAVLTAGIRFIFTIIASVLLAFVGRRTIGIWSAVGATISAFCIAISLDPNYNIHSYFIAVLLFCYVATVTIGISTLPGVMVGELFPTKLRGTAVAIVYTILNILLFGFIKIFPFLRTLLGIRAFFSLFGASSVITVIFIYFVLPETKERTLDEIEDYFLQNNILWTNRNRRNVENQACKL